MIPVSDFSVCSNMTYTVIIIHTVLWVMGWQGPHSECTAVVYHFSFVLFKVTNIPNETSFLCLKPHLQDCWKNIVDLSVTYSPSEQIKSCTIHHFAYQLYCHLDLGHRVPKMCHVPVSHLTLYLPVDMTWLSCILNLVAGKWPDQTSLQVFFKS